MYTVSILSLGLANGFKENLKYVTSERIVPNSSTLSMDRGVRAGENHQDFARSRVFWTVGR